MNEELKKFQEFREAMNEKILSSGHLGIKRFFALDTGAYKDGALTAQTKELLGLVASLVLRCNDCITYHLQRCVKYGFTNEQLYESFNVALIVGGSIIIPHLRKAVSILDELRSE